MSHGLQVLIPPDLDAKLFKSAQRGPVSKGEWVRRVVQQSLRVDGSRGFHDPLARLKSLNAATSNIGQMLAEIELGRR